MRVVGVRQRTAKKVCLTGRCFPGRKVNRIVSVVVGAAVRQETAPQ
jgi:hypothetical protein